MLNYLQQSLRANISFKCQSETLPFRSVPREVNDYKLSLSIYNDYITLDGRMTMKPETF